MKFILLFSLMGCSLILTQSEQLSFNERLEILGQIKKPPLNSAVNIYWHKYSIPFIEAKNDEDLAFSLGLVHAHLRIDQLEILRRIAYGRLSEASGPISQVASIDHALRIINFPKGARESLKVMDQISRLWIEKFTAGLNWYIQNSKVEHVTNKLLDSKLKPFSVEEVMSIGRVVGADLSWITYVKFLAKATQKNWLEEFEQSKIKLDSDIPSVENDLVTFFELIKNHSKSGSNSVVVSALKTKTGSSLIASDPHVGLTLPNFWLLVGIKSPSYHALGYMIPGVPIIGVGRNRDIAWGGTNMRAISSHLYDVTDIDKEETKKRVEVIKRRWWFDKEVAITETKFGPIFSDVEFFNPSELPFKAALNWQGVRGSDEILTFLNIAKAKNWSDFKKAFETYRVSAMNMTYADKSGHVGMIPAYGQPVLRDTSKTLDFLKKTSNPVIGVKTPMELPFSFDPSDGFIASANNKPFSSTKIPFAFSYSNNHRVERLQSLLSAKKIVTVAELKELQNDVFSQPSFELKKKIVKKISSKFSDKKWFISLNKWDGNFNKDSASALSFHAVVFSLAQDKFLDDPNWKVNLLKEISKRTDNFIQKKIGKNEKQIEDFLTEYKNWGEFTQQSSSSIFGLIPLIGRRYRFKKIALSGNSDTVNKYGRALSLEPANVTYGASARHISDMSDLNENYFIQNGGQDSWLMNENLNSQSKLFHEGRYLKLPLEMDKVKEKFKAGLSQF